MTPEEFYELWPFPINTKAMAFKFAKAYAEHENKLSNTLLADSVSENKALQKKVEELEPSAEAVRYMISVWDEVRGDWRERDAKEHVTAKFLKAEQALKQ